MSQLYIGGRSKETSLGCTVSVVPGYEHLGSGVMLHLDMLGDGDHRHAEVFLDDDVREWLREVL
jgi:hypothetical protein